MKKLSLYAIFMFVAFGAKTWAMPEFPIDTPKKVERMLTVGNIFVSSRLNKDDATVFVSGHFPSSCYEWARSSVNEFQKDLIEENTHVVRAYANVSQGICLPVLTPYTKEISVGALNEGAHTIRVMSGDGTYQQLLVNIR